MPDNVDMLSLGLPDEDHNLYDKKKAHYNRKFGEFMKMIRIKSKRTNCYCCSTPCTSLCNSHSIPQFCLRNLTVNGHIYYSNTLIDLPMLEKEKGLKQAGTFNLICRECDQMLFRDYENTNNYSAEPTAKMLAQIALKNSLMNIAKREKEIVLYDELPIPPNEFVSDTQKINVLDLNEYKADFEYAKKALNKHWDDYYYLAYHKQLDYVVPLAFQSAVTLIVDFEGKIINNIYDPSPKYRIQDIHVCVFPLQEHSVIFMFVSTKHRRYTGFFKQFKKLSLEEQLKALNFMAFAYLENVFIYKGIDESILNNEQLKGVARQTPIALMETPFANPLEKAASEFDWSKRHSIPNLLDKQFKVK